MIRRFMKDCKTVAATDNLAGFITSNFLDYLYNLGLNGHH